MVCVAFIAKLVLDFFDVGMGHLIGRQNADRNNQQAASDNTVGDC